MFRVWSNMVEDFNFRMVETMGWEIWHRINFPETKIAAGRVAFVTLYMNPVAPEVHYPWMFLCALPPPFDIAPAVD